MTLQLNVTNLATRVATEAKALRALINGNNADLSSLQTSANGSLVLAVNELKAAIDALPSVDTVIDDAATATGSTWSSSKISSELTSQLNAAIDGAPAALDTLNEIAAAIGDDANFAATMTISLGNRVRVDTDAQGLTALQKTNALTNIGAVAASAIGDTDFNFVDTFETGLV